MKYLKIEKKLLLLTVSLERASIPFKLSSLFCTTANHFKLTQASKTWLVYIISEINVKNFQFIYIYIYIYNMLGFREKVDLERSEIVEAEVESLQVGEVAQA